LEAIAVAIALPIPELAPVITDRHLLIIGAYWDCPFTTLSV
jgi:hypothetical protein